MKQRAVIRLLTLKKLKSRNIHAELISVCGRGALAIAPVKKCNNRFREGRTDLLDDPRVGCPLAHDFAEAIRSVLAGRPFPSFKVLCRHFRIGKATCLRILHDALELKKFHLRWIPNSLTPNQNGERVTLSAQLLRELEQSQANSFQRVIVGEESWFFVLYPQESVWALREKLFLKESDGKSTLKDFNLCSLVH
jgi:hypothetical protein